MGMAPQSVQAGDRVCIRFGGNTSFILRPTENENDSCRWVGDAYVANVMDVSLKSTQYNSRE